MAGVRGGHNGATGAGQVPVDTTFGPSGQAIFGLGLCAHRLRGGSDEPTDHGLGNFSLTDLRWIEHAEIHQRIGRGSACPEGGQQRVFQWRIQLHGQTTLLKNQSNTSYSDQIDGDATLNKEA